MNTALENNQSGNILKAFVKPQIFIAFVMAFFGTMLYNNVPANASMLVAEKGLGSASAAIACIVAIVYAIATAIKQKNEGRL